MDSTIELTLDFAYRGELPSIHTKQGDRETRFVRIKLENNKEPYKMEKGVKVFLRAVKPDGFDVYNEEKIESQDTVLVTLTEQILASDGVIAADLVMTDGDRKILSTIRFAVIVDPASVYEAIDSHGESTTITAMVERAEQAAVNAADLVTDAGLSAAASADSAEKAGISESNAKTSETNAGTSESNAKTSETNAKTSETNAAASETAAAASATSAKDEADRAATVLASAATKTEAANAVKIHETGAAITSDMVSPVEHDVECKISGVPDLTAVQVSRYGGNIIQFPYDGEIVGTGLDYTVNDDGSILVNGTANGLCAYILDRQVRNYDCSISGCPAGGDYYNGYSINGWDGHQPVLDNGKGGLVPASERTYKLGLRITDGTVCNNVLFKPMLVVGNEGKPFEPVIRETYTPSEDGKVSGMTSVSPNMTILTDNPNVVVDATYNADTRTYIDRKFDELHTAILAGGANI